MEWLFFCKGLVLGFSIAAPVGPIGVLCIRRTLAGGFAGGFLSGLGVATADAIYGCIAAFGLSAAAALLLDGKFYLHLAGGAFLLYLGAKSFCARPAEASSCAENKNSWSSYLSAFLLTLTNPMTIMSFAAVFAGLGLGSAAGRLSPYFLVAGVFTGSMLWWLVLSLAVNALRGRFNYNKMVWVNRLSGLAIAGFGVFSLWQLK